MRVVRQIFKSIFPTQTTASGSSRIFVLHPVGGGGVDCAYAQVVKQTPNDDDDDSNKPSRSDGVFHHGRDYYIRSAVEKPIIVRASSIGRRRSRRIFYFILFFLLPPANKPPAVKTTVSVCFHTYTYIYFLLKFFSVVARFVQNSLFSPFKRFFSVFLSARSIPQIVLCHTISSIYGLKILHIIRFIVLEKYVQASLEQPLSEK